MGKNGKKGNGKDWPTKEQFDWLTKQIGDFKAACRKRKYKSDFQPRIYNEWFKAFPEPGDPGPNASEEEKDEYRRKVDVRQDQIHNWFYNHTRPEPASQSDILALFSDRDKPQKSKPNGTRKKTQEQLFSKEFYTTEIKPEVDAELERMRANSTDGKLPKGASLLIVKRITHEKYTAATEEVKEHIAKLADRIEEVDVKTKEGVIDPETRKKFIADLKDLAPRIVEALHVATGWPVTLLLGGEDEEKQIKTNGYHAGKNLLGLSFKKAYPGYKTHVQEPFARFAHSCYYYGDTASSPAKTSAPSTTNDQVTATAGEAISAAATTVMSSAATTSPKASSLAASSVTSNPESTGVIPQVSPQDEPEPAAMDSALFSFPPGSGGPSSGPDPSLFPQSSDEVVEMLRRMNDPSFSDQFFPSNPITSLHDPFNASSLSGPFLPPYPATSYDESSGGQLQPFLDPASVVPLSTAPLSQPQPATQSAASVKSMKRKRGGGATKAAVSDQNIDPMPGALSGKEPKKRRKNDPVGEEEDVDVDAPRGKRTHKAPSCVPNYVAVTQVETSKKKVKAKK
ncbi:hypothetical protein VKT23_010828 [Stygiomarasmius scandens]|uniref:Uncharacterized protein n=1 Tax=Marasmiellus scandens TaxID=2682957 RepID=A0ABR1JAY7_9AGAR